MQPHEMTPPPNDGRGRNPQPSIATDSRGVVAIILGAALIVVTLLLFSGDKDDPFPVTGRDAPSTNQAPTK